MKSNKITELVIASAKKGINTYCEGKVPHHLVAQFRYAVDENVTGIFWE